MEFSLLSPYTLAERVKSSALERRKEPKALVRRRASSLNCYLPEGTSAPHRRVTGALIEPDSPAMIHAAMTLASSLLHALGHGGVPARILISPARYSDKVLASYCGTLIKAALGEPTMDRISPLLVPYLLGGMTYKGVEDLAHRAAEVMEFFPEPQGKSTMARALSSVGFGADVPHMHNDADLDPDYVEPPRKRYNNLSYQQEFLLNLPPTDSYARLLIERGAYDATLRGSLSAVKVGIINTAEVLMDPAGGEMTVVSAKGRLSADSTPFTFGRAVRRVFEKPWLELDLSGEPESRNADLEILIARMIIQHLSHKVLKTDRLSATTLVGMSLVTGISIANWAEFAVYDLERRGETFITAETVEEVIAMVEVSPHYTCDQRLRAAALSLHHHNTDKLKWARRLQSPNRPLWSSNGAFYVNGIDLKGFHTYKHKPFSLSRD
ncbi:hypothetical protein HOV23_gp119 [Pseudomonas phage Lana]|uniref:Uncharacterized protein n=1 Tax=Pseudomonas phage Lana TaxID=2530172 RepID=A0A481W5T8_9CAUD|nr:hypothetical protein HOV23_gp119 [Pseudomonas phage Lana]QBJ04454.1 hypothetical protein [Pseudomonas phage Lana]